MGGVGRSSGGRIHAAAPPHAPSGPALRAGPSGWGCAPNPAKDNIHQAGRHKGRAARNRRGTGTSARRAGAVFAGATSRLKAVSVRSIPKRLVKAPFRAVFSSTSAEGVGGGKVRRRACLDPRVLRCARSKRPSGPGSRCAAAGQPAAGRAAAWGVVWTRRSGAEGRSRAAGAGGAGIVRKRFRCACLPATLLRKGK